MNKLITFITLSLASVAAFAGSIAPPATVPEPGALSLLAIGAVAGVVAWARGRNKNK
jgi:hypothetical protein